MQEEGEAAGDAGEEGGGVGVEIHVGKVEEGGLQLPQPLGARERGGGGEDQSRVEGGEGLESKQ